MVSRFPRFITTKIANTFIGNRFSVGLSFRKFSTDLTDLTDGVTMLAELETGGRLELQQWMECEDVDYHDLEQYHGYKFDPVDLKNLEHIESQGRVGFLYDRQ